MNETEPTYREVYRGHLMNWRPSALPDGRFRAMVTLVSLGSEKTVSQHFLDLEIFATLAEAATRGHSAGMAWIDKDLREREHLSDVMSPQGRSYSRPD